MASFQTELQKSHTEQKRKQIKCVVWDLDDTIWHGVLLEDREVKMAPGIAHILETLDGRGILHSIASKNSYEGAIAQLKKFEIAELFLYPQINWSRKSESVAAIAKAINIGLDSVALIDDQAFEREEVQFVHPEVSCIDARELDGLLERPEFNPRFITDDSRLRRKMYLSDIERNRAEKDFVGPQHEFLATLGMRFTLASAKEEDLKRAEELTLRTHQLNTTGYTYSYEELDYFRQSEQHKLLIAGLTDKYGAYGKIGLALVECGDQFWTLKLLLMSCRVISRGIGSIMVNYILKLAKAANTRLRAEFVATDRNRMMYVTYKLGNFRSIQKCGDFTMFENDCSKVQDFPPYIEVEIMP